MTVISSYYYCNGVNWTRGGITVQTTTTSIDHSLSHIPTLSCRHPASLMRDGVQKCDFDGCELSQTRSKRRGGVGPVVR